MPRIRPPTKSRRNGFNFKKPNLGILKIPDIKSLIFGKQPEYGSPVNATGSRGFLPVKDIRDGIIITTDNRYIKVLEILPVNFYLKSAIEQQNIIYHFASYLRIAPSNLQIIVQTGKAEIDSYVRTWMKYTRARKTRIARK
jgi:hypothetical protein